MIRACYFGQLQIAQWLFQVGADVRSVTHPFESTPLLMASQAGNLHIVNWLVRATPAAADLSRANKLGETPLSWACREGYLEIARCLVAAGADRADLSRPNSDGWRPFRLASAFEKLHVAVWLIGEGALCGADSHVDYRFVTEALGHRRRDRDIRGALVTLADTQVAAHKSLIGFVLAACRRPTIGCGQFSNTPNLYSEPLPAIRLIGDSALLMMLVCDFLGAPIGRRLRNLLEFIFLVKRSVTITSSSSAKKLIV